jgi:hypothetical protein
LVKHQPITLSINGATGDAEYNAAAAQRATGHAAKEQPATVAKHLRCGIPVGGG